MTPPPSPLFDAASLTSLIGRRVLLRGQFVGPVTLDGVEDLGSTVSLRVRLPDGALRETVLDIEELNDGSSFEVLGEAMNLVDGDELFDLVEAQRIEHAYAHDPNFAVSHVGRPRACRTRSRPSTATCCPSRGCASSWPTTRAPARRSWPGCCSRSCGCGCVADRVLILCPAPLTVQWQDELHDKFDERFSSSTRTWSSGSSGGIAVAAARPLHRVDRLRQARRGAARPAARRVGPRGHRRGAQVLGGLLPEGPRRRRRARPHQALHAGRGAQPSLRAPAADDGDAALRRPQPLPQLPAAARPRPVRRRRAGGRADPRARTPPTSCGARRRISSTSTAASSSSSARSSLQPFELGTPELRALRGRDGVHPAVPRARPAAAAATPSRSPAPSCSAGSPRASARSARRCASAPTASRARLIEVEALPPAERARGCASSSSPSRWRRRAGRGRRDRGRGGPRGGGRRRRRVARSDARRDRARSSALVVQARPDDRGRRGGQARRAARLPAEGRARRADRGRPRQAADLHRAPRHARLPRSATCASGATRTCSIHGGLPADGAQGRPAGVPPEQADLRRDRGGRRGHQPPVLPPDDQLRPAVEPGSPRAAHGPHPPHRPAVEVRRSSTSAPRTPSRASCSRACWRSSS